LTPGLKLFSFCRDAGVLQIVDMNLSTSVSSVIKTSGADLLLSEKFLHKMGLCSRPTSVSTLGKALRAGH
jgi:hypothetical protein